MSTLTVAQFLLIGFLLLVLSWTLRRGHGFRPGRTLARDDLTLVSERLGLIGRPDRLVEDGKDIIPEEWKSSRRVSDSHRMQLGTYLILVEESYGVRPPYGVVVLGDGSSVKVENTEELRSEVLAIAERIREHRGDVEEPMTVNQPVQKCRACGQRQNCSVSSIRGQTKMVVMIGKGRG